MAREGYVNAVEGETYEMEANHQIGKLKRAEVSNKAVSNPVIESHGKDIRNTDSEKSTHSSKEDEYEDSFIDDSEPKVSPFSPWSDGRESDQEMLDKKKSKGRKGTRKRRKKKYQPIESDDNNSLQQNIANHLGLNIDTKIGEMSNKKSEDGYHPTSTPNSEANVVTDGGVGRDMGLPCDSILPPNAIGPENGLELNKEIANRPGKEKTLETYSVTSCDAINEDKLQHKEEKRDNEDLLGKNGDDKKSANDNKESKKRKQREDEGKTEEDLKEIGTLQDKLYDPLLSSTDAGSDNGLKPNKRRKESADYGKSLEGNTSNNNIPGKDNVKKNEGGAGQTVKDLDEKSETDQKTIYDK
ncbi:uncharacterized protein LOC127804560 [Diospyros lotus]|uniref:uncharacterized protein LOC127804560 n=1 Tax=Diospyros lotus TaxID=55363 RepID=UPI00224E6652|nr:uncharacterized protein LOC127804560 [Diospyros lotus]